MKLAGLARQPEALPLVDIKAETVADAFFSEWIAPFGTLVTITTNRGAQFESRLWDNLCNQFGIIRKCTTSYHPQSNGMVKLLHRQLKAAINAEGCSALNQHWVFERNSRTFEMLHFNIELTVVIASNTKR